MRALAHCCMVALAVLASQCFAGEGPTLAEIPIPEFGEQRSPQLSVLLSAVSAKCHIAVCCEDIIEGGKSTLDPITVPLDQLKAPTLERVLSWVKGKYPRFSWRISGGVLNVMSSDSPQSDLDRTVKPFEFKGTVDELLTYLRTEFRLTLSRAVVWGPRESKRSFVLHVSKDVTVREVMLMLSRDHGITWYAWVPTANSTKGHIVFGAMLAFADGGVPIPIREKIAPDASGGQEVREPGK